MKTNPKQNHNRYDQKNSGNSLTFFFFLIILLLIFAKKYFHILSSFTQFFPFTKLGAIYFLIFTLASFSEFRFAAKFDGIMFWN